MTEIIAERPVYAIVDGAEVRVLVKLRTPEQIGEDEWRCRFTFEGDRCPAMLKDGAAGGVDAMQALSQALQGIGVKLDDSGVEWDAFPEDAYDQPRRLARDHLFPHRDIVPSFLGPAFRKRMESHVEQEIAKEIDAKRQAREDRSR